MLCDSHLRKPLQGEQGIEAPCSSDAQRVALGATVVDQELNGGLLAHGLHEFYASTREDGAAALGFSLLLGHLCQNRSGRALIWAREEKAARQGGHAYGPGLAELGIGTSMVTLLLLPDAKAVLRAALDAARDTAAAAVVIELSGRQPLLDLTATRRFALAVEKNTMVLIARPMGTPTPSAAHSRWRVAAAPSRALEAHAPGAPAFALELLRQRGGRDGLNFIMEWDRDSASFRLRDSAATAPPLSRPSSAVAVGGADDSARSRAA